MAGTLAALATMGLSKIALTGKNHGKEKTWQ
ncbi:hypothetical protein COLO4_32697 [Corchorus olitorius]|uniref:Uncharacterized protein n=1 Tax=Corchorus olitorius TaxID=93759 RepID=A0A1R3GYH6_9ROSI|nr:hypothetical protein COLO4_32697 [Corchorus olitorius]